VGGRALRWDGCLNVRDLGGHPTEDGRTTRFGAVVRADSVARLSESGWAALNAYGVSRIIDLREHEELANDRPHVLAGQVVQIPFLRDFPTDAWAAARERARSMPDVAAAKATLYLAALDHCAPALAEVLCRIADAPPGAVVVHCAAGKDRTGLVVALLLRACGVTADDVDADYAESEANLREHDEPWVTAAVDDAERERRRRTASSPAGTMVRVLAAVERSHSSVDAYLASCGVREACRDRLRSRLVG